jgi:hypothetical protein
MRLLSVENNPRSWPCLLLALGAVPLFLALSGCRPDSGISQRTEPKPDVREKPTYRLLGAIVPREGDGEKWFFLLVGADERIKPLEREFEDFLKTVEIPGKGDAPISWREPAHWKKGPAGQFRYAAFILGEEGKEVLLTASQARGTFAANMKRWRADYLGQPALPEKELGTVSRDMMIAGQNGSWIDMNGPGGKLLKSRTVN